MDYDWTYVCTPNQTFYTEGQLLDCDIKIPLEANMPCLSVRYVSSDWKIYTVWYMIHASWGIKWPIRVYLTLTPWDTTYLLPEVYLCQRITMGLEWCKHRAGWNLIADKSYIISSIILSIIVILSNEQRALFLVRLLMKV